MFLEDPKKPRSKKKLSKAPKAYDNSLFMHSKDGRAIRILSEYLYPQHHLKKNNVNKFIIFFGSARIMPIEKYNEKHKNLIDFYNQASDEQKPLLNEAIQKFEKQKVMSTYYDQAVELASMISQWSKGLPENHRFHICTGGGPGIMEAASKGAYLVGADAVGLNISLPFEQNPNPYLSPDLNFEFHYFFMRKLWFASLAKAMIVMPGGFGTFDELMEILTLRQTEKISRPLPIIMYGSEFWKKVINFDYLCEMGMIKDIDMHLFEFADSPQEAFDKLIPQLVKIDQIEVPTGVANENHQF
ncbi:MAG: TIGR00730 family Rossman fold protein [Candidatus Kapabacteria bacterium]|nr:TIGR00730 family Rossman fold protein [Candidatus Kapabacteria bacterium]